MSELRRVGGLDVEQNLDFASQDWRFQRVGMAVGASLLILVALGFTGSGPLSKGDAGGEGLRIEYNRFPRRDTATDYLLRVMPRAAGAVEVHVLMDQPKQFEVAQITPNPQRMTATPGGWLLRFERPPAGALFVSLTVLPRGWGMRHVRFRVAAGADARTSQFVWF